MKCISMLLVLMSTFVFSCKLYEALAEEEASIESEAMPLDEAKISSLDKETVPAVQADGTPEQIVASVGLEGEESKKFEHLKGSLGDAIKVNGKGEEKRKENEERQKEFFDWLDKNDPDLSKRKELAELMKKVYGLLKEHAQNSEQIKSFVEGTPKDENVKKIGVTSARDIKTDEQVEALIKAVLGHSEESGTNLSLFFQKLGDAFGTEDGESQKSNEKILEELKRVCESSDEIKKLKEDLKIEEKVQS
ncbi:hypothetical protein DB313_04745 (plasmid) [Borrelia turcica IST7]|uniref:Mlp family lipoprotein n=1 Tax=Borrelia turcica IST7 TaxID=1104446 RepID=A0A386PPX1_9SPIR|nr:Mlp family lipoprotein [Borrelia turcica]AYE36810.1 hypothetical protein DB313_04745 [Borrelia turcica IST7]